MRPTVTIAGLKQLDAALGELSKAAARGVLQRVLLKAADPMHQAAIDKAPEKSGVLKSNVVKTTKKPAGHASKAAFAQAFKDGGDLTDAVAAQRDYNRANGAVLAEVFVGVKPGVAQAWPQELGTARHGPHPYIRPAYDETVEEAERIIRDELAGEIAKAAQRARRKALKKSLKG